MLLYPYRQNEWIIKLLPLKSKTGIRFGNDQVENHITGVIQVIEIDFKVE